MNTVYKLIFNVSTGTWAVASELTASRGKKSRTRLAAAMAVAMAMPAGASMAADSPEPLQCAVGQSFSADGLRCEFSGAMSPMSGGIGTMATDAQVRDYIAFGVLTATPGGPVGTSATSYNFGVAIGSNATVTNWHGVATGVDSTASYAGAAFGRRAIAGTGNIRNASAFGAYAEATGSYASAIGSESEASGEYSVALGAESIATQANTVSIGNATTQRRLVNLAAGTAGTDAVNVAQLTPIVAGLGGGASINPTTGAVTGPTYNIGGTNHTTVGDALDNLDTRTNDLSDSLVSSGLVDASGNAIAAVTYTDDTRGEIALGGASGTLISNLQAGEVSATSDEAINGAQLHGSIDSVASAIGGGSTVNADGTISAPSFEIGGSDYASVGDAFDAVDGSLTGLDTRVGGVEGDITTIQGDVTNIQGDITNLTNGTVGIVKYDAATDQVNVASDLPGETVNFASTIGTRTLAGVKAGVADTDAANFAQLKGTATSVASAIGGGSTVNADGTISAPSFTVGGTAYNNVGEALTNIDGRTTVNTTDLVDLTARVDLIGSGVIDPLGVAYTDTAKGEIALTGASGTIISNLLAGEVSATSDEAINGAQLHGTVDSVASAIGGGSTVNADGTISAPSFDIGGSDYASVGDAFDAVDGSLTGLDTRVGVVEGDITTIQGNVTTIQGDITNLTNGTIGIVKFDAATEQVNVASDLPGETVNFASTIGTRTLAGVKAGVADTDAANFAQLKGTATSVASAIGGGSTVNADGTISAPSFTVGGTAYNNVGAALTNIDGRTTVNTTDLVDLTARVDLIGSGVIDPLGVAYTDTTKGEIALTGASGTIISNLLAGEVSATSDEAINGAQLHGAVDSVASAIGGGSTVNADGTISAPSFEIGGSDYASIGDAFDAVDGSLTGLDTRVGVVEGDITTIQGDITNLTNGTVGIVKYDAATDEVNVATDMAGETVNFAGTAGERTLAGVKAGVADTDAANFAQLKGTATSVASAIGGGSTVNADGTISAPSFTVGGTAYNNVGAALTNIDGRTTVNTTDLVDLTARVDLIGSGVADPLAVAYTDTAKGEIALAGTGGSVISNLLAGEVSATSSEAINGAQLHGSVDSVASAIGGGSTVNADGTISAPSFEIGGSDYSSVGDAFTAVDTSLTDLDGRVTGNSDNITNLTQQFDSLTAGTAGIVTYDVAAGTVKVASAQAGDTVDFANVNGDSRKLVNVAAGVDDGDAANVAQLKGTAQSVADAVGGGSVVNPDGTISAPSYTIDGTTVTNVGDALTNIDGRVISNTGDITNLTTVVTNLSNGTAGLVTIDPISGNVHVAAEQGGEVVDLEGTDGARRVSGVANGTGDDDAVTIAQLRAAGAIDPVSGQTLSVLTYDDVSLGRATLGGTNGTVIANLANGLVGAGSREAINGGQLFDMGQALQGQIDGLDGRVGVIEQGIADGSIGGGGGGGGAGGELPVNPGTGEGSLVIGDGASAGGDGGVAVGDGTSAGGDGSVAIGDGGSAGGNGSVAIGDGASAGGNESVAIGKGSTADGDNEFSVGSAGNERVISNVAAGTRPTDAVNVQQMDDRFQAERDWSNSRFQAVDKRIDRMGAISAAYAGMAINTAGLEGEHRMGAGIGSQNGRTALAVGYQRVMGEKKNISVSLGGAFSGSDRSVSAGAGFSW